MFGKFRRDESSIYDELIETLLTEMRTYGPDSEEYSTMMRHLKDLIALKTIERSKPVSQDTMAIVIGNLAGILIIVAYEQKHVMTSKGLSFIKPREPHI